MTLLFIEKSIRTYIYIYSYILIVKARNEEYFFVQFIHRCGGRRERETGFGHYTLPCIAESVSGESWVVTSRGEYSSAESRALRPRDRALQRILFIAFYRASEPNNTPYSRSADFTPLPLARVRAPASRDPRRGTSAEEDSCCAGGAPRTPYRGRHSPTDCNGARSALEPRTRKVHQILSKNKK